MKIFLLTRKDQAGYDEYDSCVVVAESKEDAVQITPEGSSFDPEEYLPCYSWVVPSDVICKDVGEAGKDQKRGLLCASFNAG